ncbi:unnamed protein product [Closterium sp. NIES-53]
MTLRPSTAPQHVPLPSPPVSSSPCGPDPESDSLLAASPTVTHFLATVVTDPLFDSSAASVLVAELVDFAAACRLDYATSPVAESASASVCPPSVEGECALGTDVLEDRQEEFECFAAAVPHLVSMLLAPEGDPDAPDIPTPRSYAEAIEGPYSSQWQAAMDAKMASKKSTGTYVDEAPPSGANIVSGMWIFRVKRPPGSPPVFKAHYVARGFSQRQGRDYKLHSLDFSIAFLQGSLHEEIWLRHPPGFTGSFPASTQWSLWRPVYGLRQVPREWHDTLRTTLAALGFAPSPADPSLFLRTNTTLPPFYVLVYVDDLVFAIADTEALAHVNSELQKRHTSRDLGELTSYLGLRLTRDRAQRTITLTQSHMVQQVLQRFGFTYSSPQSTPLPTGHSFSAPPSDESVEPSGPYPELVGCLMYLMTCTRPDLAYPLSLLARYVAPGKHRKNALATQRSSQGYTFSLGSGYVSWRSTRSSSVLSSSCEAEIYAGAMAAQELCWLTYLLTDLGEAPRSPPVLYQHGQLRLAYVASQANTADVFTKALQPCDHQPCFAFLDWSCDLLFSPTLPMGPGVTEPGGAEPGGAGSARVASRGASSRREVLSPQELREWFARRWSRAAGAGGTTATTGSGGSCPGGAGAAGPGGPAEAAGVGPPGGSAGASGGTGAAGSAGPAAAGATGVGAGDSADAGTSEGAGAGAAGAGGATGAGAPAGSPGAVPAGSGGAPRPRPYFVPLLEQDLGLPPSPSPAPPFECPQPVPSQSLLQPVSPLPAPSPYTGPTGGLAERRAPASRPASPARPACTSRRTSRSRPPAVPGTHQMALRPSTAPLRVPLPSPPASSLPAFPDPESDSLRAASPTVSRFLATFVTDPSLASTAASALVAELVDFAASCRLDYAASLVAESASVCPPSVGGECALSTDVLEDRQEEFQCFAAALPHLVSTLLAPEGDSDGPDIPTPRSYSEAIEGPYSSQWQAAMDAEMASWKSTGTYVDEVPPPGANIVSGMWIFRVKRPPGSLPVFKARYVARGFSQRQGVDYFETFSPTPKMTTLRVLLHVAAQRDYELHSLDFSTAFLQGSLHEEIWLSRTPGFTGSFPPGTQWSLRRPVYGLRQAPREWHDTLRTTLAALGFAPSTADPSLFLRTDTSLPPFYVLVYVLQRFDFTYSSPQATPLSTRHSLSALPSDESVEPSGPYPELVGCLMYLMTCTRPDLAYPLSILARYVAPGRHRPEHMAAAKRVLRYLCSTSGMGLVLGGRRPVVLTGHADASWADDQATQRSSQGYTFSLGSGSVSWRSTRSSSVLSSTSEAEIYAGAMAAQELRWLTYLLTDLGEQPRSPPVLYVDNKAMLALCREHRLEHRTKHIALRYFLARELQQRGQLRLAYVASEANTADIFTKALAPGDHQRFCTLLGLVPTWPHLLTS